jgi:NADH:ubiquinone oxidoreductase subunit C
MSEEQPIVEDSQLVSIAKGWNGTLKEVKTIYNRKNISQVELLVDKNDLLSLASYLKEQGWNYVTSLSGVDYPERAGEELEAVYHFGNFESPKLFVVKSRCSYAEPTLPSLEPILHSINFHERETHDLFGIKFTGHVKADPVGNLPKLMLPDDWPQHPEDPEFPFRKAYVQKPRPFEKVTDTRGHQGEHYEPFHRPIDRSGWLDEYYKEDSPESYAHTKRKNRVNKPAGEVTEVEDPESEYSKQQRKHF